MKRNLFKSKFGFKGFLKFGAYLKNAANVVNKASDAPLEPYPHFNKIGNARHPHNLITAEITAISDIIGTDVKVFRLHNPQGDLPRGRAGQYTALEVIGVNGASSMHPYSIISDISSDYWDIAIEDSGKTGSYLCKTLSVGSTIRIAAPIGEFYYEDMRDEKLVIGLTEGIGIAPFLSMANAIVTGKEDFRLTVYCQNSTDDSGLFDMFADFDKKTDGKVKAVFIKTPLSVDTILEEQHDKPFSVYVNAPFPAFYGLEELGKKLAIDKKHLRTEAYGEIKDVNALKDFPTERRGEFTATVTAYGKSIKIAVNSEETLLTSIERSDIKPLARCRSGECGWCRSRLISGSVYTVAEKDTRRQAEKKFGYIHPCISYPLSDLEIAIEIADGDYNG